MRLRLRLRMQNVNAMPSCTRLPSSFYILPPPSIPFSSELSVCLSSAPSVYLSSATSVYPSQLGVPRIASASLSSWADYPSFKLTSLEPDYSAVVPIALDVLEQRDHRRLRRNCTEAFASQRTLREPHEIPFETWERLLCFHKIVESFISSFASSRLVALENAVQLQTRSPSPHDSPERHPDLSQIEYARLARAFYHLELFGNLFYDVDTNDARLGRGLVFDDEIAAQQRMRTRIRRNPESGEAVAADLSLPRPPPPPELAEVSFVIVTT